MRTLPRISSIMVLSAFFFMQLLVIGWKLSSESIAVQSKAHVSTYTFVPHLHLAFEIDSLAAWLCCACLYF